MRTVPSEEFYSWARARQLSHDKQYLTDCEIQFDNGGGESRYWKYPQEVSDIPHFIKALLAALGPPQRYWLYPNRGSWSLGAEMEALPQYQVWLPLIRGLGIEKGFFGAVSLDLGDLPTLFAFLFLQITLGPAVFIDTFLIPEDPKAILYFSHHEVVEGSFRDSFDVEKLVETLTQAGYPLPTEARDDTFKPVSWMSEEDDPGLTEEEALLVAELPKELVAQIDAALLAEAAPQWRKVARIVGGVMSSFTGRPKGIPDVYYAQRVAQLVEKGFLESQGNLRRMRFSEVRLPHQ